MKKIIIVIAFLASINSYCQDTTKQYFDAKWDIVKKPKNAQYVAKWYKNSDGDWEKKYYFITGEIYMEGLCHDASCSQYEGEVFAYYKNGEVKMTGNYNNGKMIGEWKFYNENGKLDHTKNYDKIEKSQISNSNGFTFEKIEGASNPEFSGGIYELYGFLGKNIKYPSIAQKNNISGKVSIKFVVNEDGSLSNFQIVSSPHESLSEEALRVVSLMPKWKPAQKDGENLKSWCIMPVFFQLE